MQLTDFKVLTFDCYGTLIDWESGIAEALRPLLARSGKMLSRDKVLESFARYEAAQQSETPSMIYSELLGVVHARMASEWGVEPSTEESKKFGRSVSDWPVFTDSPAALQYLKKHYKLVILSNVDRESFQGSNRRLQIEFDYIFTAQDIGSYKPNPRNFAYMIKKLSDAGIKNVRFCTPRKVSFTITSRPTTPDSPPPGSTDAMRRKGSALRIHRRRGRNTTSCFGAGRDGQSASGSFLSSTECTVS
jgi:2-haloacid dehalogenase